MTKNDSLETAAACRAAVFDLDGTLVDSMSGVLDAYVAALAPYRKMTREEVLPLLGGPPKRFFQDLLGNEEAAEAAWTQLEGTLRMPEAFEGMRKMLDTLRASGVKLAIWTGRDRVGALEILKAQGIEDLFEATVCGDDLTTNKPHPGGLLEVLSQLGVSADETIFAGDSDVDVLGGFDAGVRTLLITHGRLIPPEVETKAWRTVETPEVAYALLTKLVK